MGAIKAKFDAFKQPKQLRAPRSRKPQTVFGPSKVKDAFKVNVGQAYSMANRMVTAENRRENAAWKQHIQQMAADIDSQASDEEMDLILTRLEAMGGRRRAMMNDEGGDL